MKLMRKAILALATFLFLTPNVFAGILLTELGSYETGSFDEGAAEIVAHDPATQKVFFINGDSETVDILDISNPASPAYVGSIDVSMTNGVETSPNSVDVKNGVVAVALENGDDKAGNGFVAFFATDGTPLEFDDGGSMVNFVEVGVLPDAIKFNSDGTKLLTSNEAEAFDEGGMVEYPEGSVSLVELSANFSTSPTLPNAITRSIADDGFDARKEDLKARGIKLQDGINPSQDLEPELAAFSSDENTAFVTLQEGNAFGVLDLTSGLEFIDVLPLGFKDHSIGQPELTNFKFIFTPRLGRVGRKRIKLGGFSGLSYAGTNHFGRPRFVTVPDRGPNGETFNDPELDCGDEQPACRPFLLPKYKSRIVTFDLLTRAKKSLVRRFQSIYLTRQDGVTPITGISNIPGIDERPVDAKGNPVNYDEFGGDFESVTIDPDGSYWLVDEYRPSIFHFDEEGVLIDRYVPEGTAAQNGDPAGTYGSETLPSVYKTRRANRGFEAGALDTENDIFYAFIQTPLANPDRDASDNSKVIRILGIDPANGTPVEEYVYLLEDPDYRPGGRVDKIGDAVFAGNGQFYVIERDSTLNDETGKKFIFKIDLKYATNILGTPLSENETGLPDLTLEQLTVEEIVAQGISPVEKMKVLNLPSLGYTPSDKAEGITLMPDGKLAVLNDNDFGLGDDPSSKPVLGLIDLNENNKLDPSNKDDAINIANHPVFGMYQPDTIASCEIAGNTFYITANEGDSRDLDNFSEEERVEDLDLFGFPVGIQDEEVLGRLHVTTLLGNLDGDPAPTFEKLFAYGSRSFSIWDEYGNQIFDSGDDFEQITAAQLPLDFNSTNDENDSFDNRSDDKGPEPEAIACGEIGGKTYGFIGLERIGGIMVYDITDPYNPEFVLYKNNRDFTGDAEAGTAGDLAPESIAFIKASDSPSGKAMIVVGNEVSGTVTLYEAD